MNAQFWKGKTVFVTGHTGFKGGWLTLYLHQLGAHVVGYALEPDAQPNLFTLARIGEACKESYIGDVRNLGALRIAMMSAKPDIVMHLAAQPLVRKSYADPIGTYSTNVLGTANVLEAVRATPSVKVCLVVTTDKCYENREWSHAYREIDALGGYDPYSSSKACAELVVAAYRRSFFKDGVSVSTARAGNVIGGGDWSQDRLIPDAMRAFSNSEPLIVRSPDAIRPWQHVLEPIAGYLALAEKQWENPELYADAFNLGPSADQRVKVGEVADLLVKHWGQGASWHVAGEQANAVHEARELSLDISRARDLLGWKPIFTYEQAIERTVQWYTRVLTSPNMARELCVADIDSYTSNL